MGVACAFAETLLWRGVDCEHRRVVEAAGGRSAIRELSHRVHPDEDGLPERGH